MIEQSRKQKLQEQKPVEQKLAEPLKLKSNDEFTVLNSGHEENFETEVEPEPEEVEKELECSECHAAITKDMTECPECHEEFE